MFASLGTVKCRISSLFVGWRYGIEFGGFLDLLFWDTKHYEPDFLI
jgi:hypothetical protein